VSYYCVSPGKPCRVEVGAISGQGFQDVSAQRLAGHRAICVRSTPSPGRTLGDGAVTTRKGPLHDSLSAILSQTSCIRAAVRRAPGQTPRDGVWAEEHRAEAGSVPGASRAVGGLPRHVAMARRPGAGTGTGTGAGTSLSQRAEQRGRMGA
jgi:hypothetical protein